MMNEKYYVELDKLNKLLERKNKKTDFYNGIYDRYEYPVLTREMIPLTWRYDLNPETNPYFIERLGVNAVMNSGAIYLNGKYYLVARIEGNDRKSFFGVAESDNGIDGFRFWDYPILLDDVCPEETNVYDMRLTQHEDGWIYGVFCSESKDTTVNDLSAAVAAAGIVRTKDLKHWERLDNLKTLRSPQQRNVVLHPEFVDGKYAFYTRPMDEYEFAVRETKTYEVIEDVKEFRSEIGIIYINDFNQKVLTKMIKESDLEFHPILDCGVYVYLWKGHPLANKEEISIEEHMEIYEKKGMSRKDAMKQVAKDRGVSKRDIYSYLMK